MRGSTGTHAGERGRQHQLLTDELAGTRPDAELSPPGLGALSTAVARHFTRYCRDGPTTAASVRFYEGYVVTLRLLGPGRS